MARQRRTGTELAKVLHLSRNSTYRRLSGSYPFDLNEISLAAAWLGVEPGHFTANEVRATA